MSMEVAGIPARGLEGNQTAPPPVLEVGKVHQEEKSSLIRERLAAQSVEKKLQDIEGLTSFLNRRLKFSINRELQEVVVKIVDADTDKVIKVLPPEELQRLHLRIRETLGLLFDELI